MLPHSARKITHQNPANPACRDIHRSVASGDREHPSPIKSAKLQRGALASFLSNLGEVSFKAAGVEASAKRQQEAAVALGAAVAARAPGDGGPGVLADPRDVAAALPSPRAQRRLQGARILWVDDRPDNNRFERQALEALGIDIDLSTSTDDALGKIRRRSYDLIISDMGRPPDAPRTLVPDTRYWTSFTAAVTRSRSSSTHHPGRPSTSGNPASTAPSDARTHRKN